MVSLKEISPLEINLHATLALHLINSGLSLLLAGIKGLISQTADDMRDNLCCSSTE